MKRQPPPLARGWYLLGAFMVSGLLWVIIIWAITSLVSAQPVTVRQMIGDPRYWPPACSKPVCVLTGLGGIVQVWERHVDTNLALGRTFIVKGLCASACEIAARRAHAVVADGAVLILHKPSPAVWS